MADDLTDRSEELAKKIEAMKRERDTPTEQELREQAAGNHASHEGTALNSGRG